ncbi:MAG: hypothetical protein KatS3mg038_3855 [Candidatus Kapaibacterium sp.]|nr:MAG: hypothetical protein KatS3mg038_0740 [Candidatus Kapabacteria bacterium]GIV51158.1 MAG: hypothetical protein KatS3mg038_1679 [Candidatus Kapabacteria bacterium]GIV52546.1 MAG: hypothetical protein KatS3mg038_3067 [Candidatus Kapabacteria bacterium]GIV52768.1 MAG: hypothetical protein KatS3mg038_3289 [Candidatus Kapabacteria bacterium]GIV53321.1 MAG: hypothetical protein KatS3mg038_3842 [Candidatus Kapabacteria bacterium]
MTWQALLLLAIVTAVAIVDVIVTATLGAQQSLSVAVYDAARHYPILAFLLGVIAGHVFWPLK